MVPVVQMNLLLPLRGLNNNLGRFTNLVGASKEVLLIAVEFAKVVDNEKFFNLTTDTINMGLYVFQLVEFDHVAKNRKGLDRCWVELSVDKGLTWIQFRKKRIPTIKTKPICWPNSSWSELSTMLLDGEETATAANIVAVSLNQLWFRKENF